MDLKIGTYVVVEWSDDDPSLAMVTDGNASPNEVEIWIPADALRVAQVSTYVVHRDQIVASAAGPASIEELQEMIRKYRSMDHPIRRRKLESSVKENK